MTAPTNCLNAIFYDWHHSFVRLLLTIVWSHSETFHTSTWNNGGTQPSQRMSDKQTHYVYDDADICVLSITCRQKGLSYSGRNSKSCVTTTLAIMEKNYNCHYESTWVSLDCIHRRIRSQQSTLYIIGSSPNHICRSAIANSPVSSWSRHVAITCGIRSINVQSLLRCSAERVALVTRTLKCPYLLWRL